MEAAYYQKRPGVQLPEEEDACPMLNVKVWHAAAHAHRHDWLAQAFSEHPRGQLLGARGAEAPRVYQIPSRSGDLEQPIALN